MKIPQDQTHDEWMDNYNRGNSQDSAKVTNLTTTHSRRLANTYRYADHRTTRRERLVLIFENLQTHESATLWFNVGLKGRTKRYPAGHHGQFIPPKLGKFRQWWMSIAGEPPPKWSRVHERLYKLRDFTFSGIAECRYSSNGEKYWYILDLEKHQKKHPVFMS